jgi:hypothetical protein
VEDAEFLTDGREAVDRRSSGSSVTAGRLQLLLDSELGNGLRTMMKRRTTSATAATARERGEKNIIYYTRDFPN